MPMVSPTMTYFFFLFTLDLNKLIIFAEKPNDEYIKEYISRF